MFPPISNASISSGLSTTMAANISEDGNSTYDGDFMYDDAFEYYPFHRPEVKVPLLILYSLVFIFAFFGNLLVVLVMVLHRRMRSHTNFFLTNLAVADLCVAVFCIYQNFAMYVIKDWYFGEFLCLMYQFVNQLSYTASVIILVVVSGERYLAIVEPLKAKTILTRRNMIITMGLVWIVSAIYSCPRLLYFTVHEYPVEDGRTEAMCLLRRDLFDTKVWDVVSLVLLYLLPLLLLTLLYARIAHTLWRSGRMLAATSSPYSNSSAVAVVSGGAEYGTFKAQQPTASLTSTSSSGGGNDMNDPSRNHSRGCQAPQINRGSVKSTLSTYVSMGSMREDGGLRINQMNSDNIPLTPLGRCLSVENSGHPTGRSIRGRTSPRLPRNPMQLHPSPLVLKARRNVIKMLIMVVLGFAGCSLPYHLRKMLQYYWSSYNHNSTASYIMTPITFLLMYANSAINPILYTFMSRKFRTSSRDLLTCRVWQATRRHRPPPPPTVVARLSGRDKVVTHLL